MHRKPFDYDSFNARYLSYKQVAESFIPNTQFEQLQAHGSILLMGPRGCGKTTLLKMLTPAGVNYYKEKNDGVTFNKINFTAVYIPCDIQWKNQLDHLSQKLGSETDFHEIIAQFLFSTNVQIALCKTFNFIVEYGEVEDDAKLLTENNICKNLIDVWEVSGPITATFDDIELKLLKRVKLINRMVNELMYQLPEDRDFKSFPSFIFESFFDTVKLGCKVFEQNMSLPVDHKWALCFDELEIAPKFLQVKLIQYLRSVDEKYFFKLTTTPLFNLENNIVEASQGNDYSTIKLWVFDETGVNIWREFCLKLITNRLKKQFKLSYDIELESVFDEYNLDDIIKDELNDLNSALKRRLDFTGGFNKGTGKGSSVNYLFKYLASIDSTFDSFLSKRYINSTDPFSIDASQAKSIFLKYKVDAAFRMIYYKRTRRNPPIHYGVPYIFDICDGNPRLVIGLVDEILRSSINCIQEKKEIAKNIQSRIILDASERYYNLLQNHPDSTIIISNSEFNLADDILTPIGDFIHDKIMQDEFSITSPSTFIIDESINHKSIKLLELALYLGAIVYLDPIESLSNKGIIGKRFRLSNFLAAKFKIPNRVSSQVNLSTILNIEKNKKQIKLGL